MSAALLRNAYKFDKKKGKCCRENFRWTDEGKKNGFAGTVVKSLKVITSLAASCGLLFYALNETVKAFELRAKPPKYPWESQKIFKSLDHAAVRRGWLVYKTVCQNCHSVEYVRFAEMVDVSHTQAELKSIAAEYEVEDGPDEEGNYYMRPARLSDKVPKTFANEEAARAANLGALPPDLSYIALARRNGYNYIFSLLTGYTDPPAGISLADGQYFNPYFPGGKIAMGQVLSNGGVEYDDGTPATVSQMAKDLIEFFTWTSSHEHNARGITLIRCLGVGTILLLTVAHMNRSVWSFQRTRQLAFVPKRKW